MKSQIRKTVSLISGFSKLDKNKIKIHLIKLFPYLKKDGFVIVGGLAIRYHILSHDLSYPKREFNDLDIIVKNPRVISPKIAKDFLIYHYHPDNFYLALVDPETKTKVDIFDFYPAPKKTVKVIFNKEKINIVSIEDQLVKTVLDINRISQKAKVDPKQFFDTKLLLKIADLKKTDELWRKNKFKSLPKSLEDAIKRAQDLTKQHPEWLKEKPFRKPKPYNCLNCKSIDGFKIIPIEKVYRILGYVE